MSTTFMHTPQLIETLDIGEWINALDFSPDGRLLAAGVNDGKIHIWDMTTRTLVTTLDEFAMSVNSLGFSRDGKTLVVGSEDGTLRFCDTSGFRDH